jgi:hypothetical protein
MPKRSDKPHDVNQLAAAIVRQSTGEEPKQEQPPEDKPKNAAAVALGRLGGLKGGKARMAGLTPEERTQLGKEAAQKRWGTKPKGDT